MQYSKQGNLREGLKNRTSGYRPLKKISVRQRGWGVPAWRLTLYEKNTLKSAQNSVFCVKNAFCFFSGQQASD